MERDPVKLTKLWSEISQLRFLLTYNYDAYKKAGIDVEKAIVRCCEEMKLLELELFPKEMHEPEGGGC